MQIITTLAKIKTEYFLNFFFFQFIFYCKTVKKNAPFDTKRYPQEGHTGYI